MTIILTVAAVFAGAFLGGALRYLLAQALRAPVGTFIANIVGSLALGLAVGFFRLHPYPEAWYAFAATGFAGGLSTWSTLAKELGQMRPARALRYGFFTLSIGIIAAWRGIVWAGRIYYGW